MKKIKFFLLSLALIAGVGVANAQEGQNAVGFNLGYAAGSHGIGNFGIGIKYSYNMSENLRVQPSFTYFFDKKDVTLKDISLDFHYLFNINDDNMFFYPIFGFTAPFGSWDETIVDANGKEKTEDHKRMRFGCNLGAGLQYNLTEDFAVVGEAKYKVAKDFGGFYATIGCVVSF